MASGKKKVAEGSRYQIYALSDPRTGEVCYIGKSADPHKRLMSHVRDSRRADRPVHRWIKELARDNLMPVVSVLVSAEDGDWEQAERAEIAKARAAGLRLLNVADGGRKPFCSLEVRQENARRVAKCHRPRGVMRLYRYLEVTARSSRKWARMLNEPAIQEKHEARLQYWKDRIKWHRSNGTLKSFDEALVKYFGQLEAGGFIE